MAEGCHCSCFLFSCDDITEYHYETEQKMQQLLLKNKFGDFPLRNIVNDVYQHIQCPSDICNEIYSYLLGGSKIGYFHFLDEMFYHYFCSLNKMNQLTKIYLVPLLIVSMEFICIMVYLFCYTNINDDDRTVRKLIIDINNYTLSIVLFIHIIFVIISIVSYKRIKNKFEIINPNKNAIKTSYFDVVCKNHSLFFPLIYQWLPFNYFQRFGMAQFIVIPIYFVSLLLFNILSYFYLNVLVLHIMCWMNFGMFLVSFVSNLCESCVVMKKYRMTSTRTLLKTSVLLVPLIICLTEISFGILAAGKINLNARLPVINLPTPSPTLSPTITPTISPSLIPTSSPTLSPTIAPTLPPTLIPTLSPTQPTTLYPTGPTMPIIYSCHQYADDEDYSSLRVCWYADTKFQGGWSMDMRMYNARNRSDVVVPGKEQLKYGGITLQGTTRCLKNGWYKFEFEHRRKAVSFELKCMEYNYQYYTWTKLVNIEPDNYDYSFNIYINGTQCTSSAERPEIFYFFMLYVLLVCMKFL